MDQELGLTLIILFLLVLKVWDGIKENGSIIRIANILLVLLFVSGFVCQGEGQLFSGMFLSSKLISLEKSILLFGTIIISLQSQQWLQKHKHLPEFFILLLTTLLGMFFMISSGNILMFYLGLELSTIPLAALANFDLEKGRSSEAAMKMIMSSAFSSGILLFGISLLYGTTGSLDFNEIATHLNGNSLQMLAFIFILSGVAFKISAVPFHLWTADVYEGAPVAITAYLSVISKGAIVFAFASFLYRVVPSLEGTWYNVLMILAVLSMTIGNIFAMRQNNIKRFLAFSSIAQAGYILLGISGGSQMGMTSSVYFILIYICSNLAAFGVISLIASANGKEDINDYKGLYKSNPALALIMMLALFSLAGIPPTAGFFGKLFLITAGAAKQNYIFLTIAALNMIVSLYYYLRVVKAMVVDENENPMEEFKTGMSEKIALIICTAGIILIGFISNLFEYIYSLSFGM